MQNIIPKIGDIELIIRHNKIKPIVRKNGEPFFLKHYELCELQKDVSACNIKDIELSAKEVLTDCVELSKIRVIHDPMCKEIFFPSISEVLSQIPKCFIKDAIAFEVISKTNIWYKDKIDQNNNTMSCQVQLYKKKDNK
ncbi:MAG: hypothetical protein RSB67_01640 [Clostridia bacterium]